MKRKCPLCGAPERTDGILSTHAPYSGVCRDCINTDLKNRPEKVDAYYAKALKKRKGKP